MAEQEENPLSERELDVMRLVATGATNQETAHSLNISPNTVKVHLRNIYEKLGVASRTEATLVAIREGWLDVPGVGQEVPSSGSPSEGESAEEPGAETSTASSVERETGVPYVARLPPWTGTAAGALVAVLLLVIAILAWQLWEQRNVEAPITRTTDVRRWEEIKALPAPRTGAAAVPYQGRVYVIGGVSTESLRAPLDVYDDDSDEWHTAASKAFPVTDARAAVLGARIYAPGGLLATGEPLEAVEVYDPQTDTWYRVADLPWPLARYALAAFEGQLFVAGGWDGERVRDEVLAYDPDEDVWVTVGRLPEARAGMSAGVASNTIYFVGGHDAEGTPQASVWRFDPVEGTSVAADIRLPRPLEMPAVAVLGDTLYLTGEGSLWRFDQQAGHWVGLEPPEGIRLSSRSAFTALDPYLYIIGGERASEGQSAEPAVVATALRYQAVFRTFVPLAPGGVQ